MLSSSPRLSSPSHSSFFIFLYLSPPLLPSFLPFLFVFFILHLRSTASLSLSLSLVLVLSRLLREVSQVREGLRFGRRWVEADGESASNEPIAENLSRARRNPFLTPRRTTLRSSLSLLLRRDVFSFSPRRHPPPSFLLSRLSWFYSRPLPPSSFLARRYRGNIVESGAATR